jgi:hypothetical protein
MSEFSLKVSNLKSGDLEWKVEGALDENAVAPKLVVATSGTLSVDFEKLSFINSKGVQKWIQIMSAIPDGVKVLFKNCPVRLVHQLNLFPSITAGKKVRVVSFYAPYFDAHLDASRDVLLNVADLQKEGVSYKVPEVPSTSGKGPLEFDAFADKYFVFLGKLA